MVDCGWKYFQKNMLCLLCSIVWIFGIPTKDRSKPISQGKPWLVLQICLHISSESSMIPCFNLTSFTVKCEPCNHSFNSNNQSPHHGMSATPSRVERKMTFKNNSWHIVTTCTTKYFKGYTVINHFKKAIYLAP